jgi:predicted permease
MATVGVVLLIACANIANLLLARAVARRPELALRQALGAGRGRLLRQLLVESLLLAALGGICGIVVARWSVRLLVVYISSGRTPIALDLSPNLRILAFTAAISIGTGIVFGLAPALRATRLELTSALKTLGSRLTRSRAGLRPGKLLAVAQVSLSLLLLIAAGLFLRSFQKLSGDDPGVPRDTVLIIGVEPRGSDQRGVPGTSVRLDRVYRGLIERVRQLPGIRSASMAQATPVGSRNTAGALVKPASGEDMRVPVLMVYPNYFRTMGIPLAAGRDFNTADLEADSPTVCIVNEAFARRMFPGQNPLGQPCLRMRRPNVLDTLARPDAPPEPYAIVGVVKDSRYTNPSGETQPVVYTTFLQTNTGRGQMSLHVQVSGNTGRMVPQIREEVWKLDPTLPMLDVHTLEEEMNGALVQQRLLAMLSTVFGGLALLLASVGLYGLFAFAVVQRSGEMGIRVALGARRRSVIWLVLREAILLVAIGVAIGIPAALAVARLVSSRIAGLLFGLEATDPSTIAIATGTLTVIACLAAYIPARRAALVDPIVTLRSE